MKKLIIFILLLFFPVIVFGGSIQEMQRRVLAISGTSSGETPTFWSKLEVEGTDGDAGKFYEEIAASWLGTVSSGVTFSAACTNNGFVLDSTEYVRMTQAEVATAGISLSKGTISFQWKPNEAITVSDFGMRFYDNSTANDVFNLQFNYGEITLTLKENYNYGILSTWGETGVDNYSFSSGVCYDIVISWDMTIATPTAVLWIDEVDQVSHLKAGGVYTQQTGSMTSYTSLYIGSGSTSPNTTAKGHLDEWKYYNAVYTPGEL